jgi:hypothetical protein
MKLGKSNPVHDPRTLKLANYLNGGLPPAPPQYDYANNIGDTEWGMMANDKIGNCTCASAGHLIMEWTDDNGSLFIPADQDIINVYIALTGYNPVTGENNTGAGATDVLNYWRKTGIASHKVLAYAALDHKDHNHIMQSVFLFGGCYAGFSLPLAAKTQAIWDVPVSGLTGDGAPGSWGGHAVPVIGYDSDGLTVVTWGAIKKMTWSFWDAYCDESYAIISTDFVSSKPAPNGFDLAALQADLKKIVSS